MKLEISDVDFADPTHRAGVVSVLDSYASDPIGGGQPLSKDVKERLIPTLREHPTTLVLLAFADRTPVGIAICFFGISTFQARALLNVHDLAVLPEFRGKGIGRALLRAVEDHAIRRGCCKLTLEVQDDNSQAIGLYKDFGFGDFIVGSPTATRFLCKPLS